jgi:hypothetical protein
VRIGWDLLRSDRCAGQAEGLAGFRPLVKAGRLFSPYLPPGLTGVRILWWAEVVLGYESVVWAGEGLEGDREIYCNPGADD